MFSFFARLVNCYQYYQLYSDWFCRFGQASGLGWSCSRELKNNKLIIRVLALEEIGFALGIDMSTSYQVCGLETRVGLVFPG